jgi:hypothetical protein
MSRSPLLRKDLLLGFYLIIIPQWEKLKARENSTYFKEKLSRAYWVEGHKWSDAIICCLL